MNESTEKPSAAEIAASLTAVQRNVLRHSNGGTIRASRKILRELWDFKMTKLHRPDGNTALADLTDLGRQVAAELENV